MDKENLKRLSTLRKEAFNAIKKYNLLAEKLDFTERLGLASAELDNDDVKSFREDNEGDEELLAEFDAAKSKTNFIIDYYAEDGANFASIASPGTEGYWFPSSIC